MLYVVGNGMLLLFVLIELALSRIINGDKFNYNDIVFNINSGHIMLWVIRSVELGIYHFASQYLNFHLVSWMPSIFLWLLAFILWDFSFYWYHRVHHKYRLLWYIHVVHHEGEEFNLSLGIRNSWYSALTTIPFFIWLAIIGIPFEMYTVVSIVHYFIQFLNHNSLVSDIGILRWVFVSPAHHKVHHGKQGIYHNTNFGGTLVWWDFLFNTYQKEEIDQPVVVGIANAFQSQNIFEVSNNRFLNVLNIRLNHSKKRYFTIPEWFLLLITLVTFYGFLMYIHFENAIDFNLKFLFFLVIFLAINAIGGLSEGELWSIVLWTMNAVVFTPLFLYELYGYTICFKSATVVLIITSVLAIYFSLRSEKEVESHR